MSTNQLDETLENQQKLGTKENPYVVENEADYNNVHGRNVYKI